MEGLPRDEHLAWAKRRALEYLDAGDIKNAVISLGSDCNKHFDLATHPGLMIGVMSLPRWLEHRDHEAVRDWIEGFR